MVQRFRDHPEKARAFIEIVLENYQDDGDVRHLMGCFQNVIDAQGGTGKVARRMKMTKTDLEKRLKSRAELRHTELIDMLQALGIQPEYKQVA